MSLPVAFPGPSPQAVAPAAADFRGPALFGHHRVQQIPPGADRPVTGAAAASRSAGLCDTWPLLQRQRLEKVDAHLLHERLIAWCRNLPPDSQQRPPLEAQLAKTPSSLALFASLTQQMRAAQRLSCHQEKAGCALETQCLEGNPYSPDGTHLVLSCDSWNDEGEGCCLWRLEAERAHKAAFLPLESSFDCCALTFSAGSQRLLAASRYGQLQIWHRRADDSWQEAASVRLWTGTARAARFSPDGLFLFCGMDCQQLSWRCPVVRLCAGRLSLRPGHGLFGPDQPAWAGTGWRLPDQGALDAVEGGRAAGVGT